MRTLSHAHRSALAARRLVVRHFLSITAKDRTTGEQVQVGFWSDLVDITALVKDADSGLPVLRSFYGAGGLVKISDIAAVAGVTVQRVEIDMSQLDEMVEQAIRLYDVKQGRIEVHEGLLDPDTQKLIDTAEILFIGYCDEVKITTPAENEEGSITLTCTSHTQELARSNPETRSHEDQQLRQVGDGFFKDAATCGEWTHHWGATQGQSQSQQKKGLFGWGGFLGFL